MHKKNLQAQGSWTNHRQSCTDTETDENWVDLSALKGARGGWVIKKKGYLDGREKLCEVLLSVFKNGGAANFQQYDLNRGKNKFLLVRYEQMLEHHKQIYNPGLLHQPFPQPDNSAHRSKINFLRLPQGPLTNQRFHKHLREANLRVVNIRVLCNKRNLRDADIYQQKHT